MDKRIVLSVAGSGKTTYIVDLLNEEKRFLITTYTTENLENLRKKIIVKFGYFPSNIKLVSYYSFLYSFCISPFLSYQENIKGITWRRTNDFYNTERSSFITKNNNIYSDKISLYIIKKGIFEDIKKRFEKYYDYFIVDEAQDFSAYDFDLLIKIIEANLNLLFVGDFYQHTFSTSTVGNKGKSIYINYEEYKRKFKGLSIVIEEELLVKSHRCTPGVCNFIKEKLHIEIQSHKKGSSEGPQLIIEHEKIEEIMGNDKIVKLFYKEHNLYNCNSNNWGNSKGSEYDDVCVVLNDKTIKLYKENKLSELKPLTRSKFYVACTRTKNNLYFIEEKKIKHRKKEGS